ncbi:MAG TPA: hypothetical protein VKQ70_17685 [Caulobacteraceae bacterium]|jgi:hypothetical protein|nr:hypothetical protein [Caulobacteraceae bacterium]
MRRLALALVVAASLAPTIGSAAGACLTRPNHTCAGNGQPCGPSKYLGACQTIVDKRPHRVVYSCACLTPRFHRRAP